MEASPFALSLYLFLFLFLFIIHGRCLATDFLFNGFREDADLNVAGSARITSDGILQLTDESSLGQIGHAFFSSQVHMLSDPPPPSKAASVSFSTVFVFDIVSIRASGHGFAFVVSPSKLLSQTQPDSFLGLFNLSNNGNSSNHIFAVEFDTVKNQLRSDIDDNHVGLDINGVVSVVSESASYYTGSHNRVALELDSNEPIQAWIDYNGITKSLNVTVSPLSVLKPRWPLISYAIDLSSVLEEFMYVGFSASTGQKATSNHYILGWSFKTEGVARALDLSRLPRPSIDTGSSSSRWISRPRIVVIGLICVIVVGLAVGTVTTIYWFMRKQAKLSENLEEWELNYPHRLPYKDLYRATRGFKATFLLGKGGFGQVYKGILPRTGEEVAIKRIGNNSRQGMREFIAEVASLGRMRHRNLVQLKGWCKRLEELILVYEYMPNGSLDVFLFGSGSGQMLSWNHRFKILKGIACGLLYLHEEWEQVVVHRDIKSSNVLLDADMNGKLSDFGLAKLYEHGTNPHTTHVVGTLGYIAPELSRTGKATASSDVFAFGVLLLEVACGRRPIEPNAPTMELLLINWVRLCKIKGQILEAVDAKLNGYYDKEEMEMVLNLGLVCCQSVPEARPTMKQVIAYLDRDEHLKDDVPLVFSEADPLDLPFVVSYASSSQGQMSTSSMQQGR